MCHYLLEPLYGCHSISINTICSPKAPKGQRQWIIIRKKGLYLAVALQSEAFVKSNYRHLGSAIFIWHKVCFFPVSWRTLLSFRLVWYNWKKTLHQSKAIKQQRLTLNLPVVTETEHILYPFYRTGNFCEIYVYQEWFF